MGASTKTYFVDDVGVVEAGLSSLRCEPAARSSRWYALYVRSRHEKVVEAGLKGKGYSAFSPFYRTKRKRVDRIADIDVPLFPGYVFCLFDSNKRLPILMTPGIVGIVGRVTDRSRWKTSKSHRSERWRCPEDRFSPGLS